MQEREAFGLWIQLYRNQELEPVISVKPIYLPDISEDATFVKFTVGQVTGFFVSLNAINPQGVHDLADFGYLVSDGGKELGSQLKTDTPRSKSQKTIYFL